MQTSKKQYKSRFIVNIVGFFAFLMFWSCTSNVATNKEKGIKEIPVSVSKKEVNWVGHWLHEGDREKLLHEIANEYEFLNQDVKINMKFPEDLYAPTDAAEEDFIISQMKMPVAEWDVIRLKEHYNPIARKLNDPLWGPKYLVDFTKVPGFLESHGSFISSNTTKSRAGGIIVGPYNEGQLWALFVNLNVAKRMGIEVKQYGMTFDDFLGYIKAAYAYNQSHSYIAPIFEDQGWISMEALFKELFYSLIDTYEEAIDTRVTPKKIVALQKCYEALGELAKYKPIIRTRSKIQWSRDNDYPLKDSCLFMVNGTWMYNIWKLKGANKMSNVLPCELPVFRPSDSYIGGYASNFAVLKNGPHVEAAIKLMMYWCTPHVAEKWVRYTKSPSGVKGNLTSTAFGIDPYESYMYTMENKYGAKKFPQAENQYMLGEKNLTSIKVIEVLEGKVSPEQAFEDVKRSIPR
jgi:ABC-type glycerol-3-phosphate transport system substrate-binding protein